MSAYRDYMNRKRNERESSNTLSSSSSNDYRSYMNSQKYGFGTLAEDEAKTREKLNSVYNGWQTQEDMASYKESVSDMYKRLRAYQDSGNGSEDLNNLITAYSSALGSWDDMSNIYSQYKNADAYNIKKNESDWVAKNSGLTYEDVQKRLLTASGDEADYLNRYGIIAGYGNLEDYDKDLANRENPNSIKNQLKNGSGGVAGRTSKAIKEMIYGKDDTEDTTYEELSQARNLYDAEHSFDKYKELENNSDFAEKSQTFSNDKMNNGNGRSIYAPLLNKMTDEEKSVANYISNTNPAELETYLRDIQNRVEKRSYESTQEKLNNLSDGIVGGTLATAGAFATNLISEPLTLLEEVGGALGGHYSPYSGASELNTLTQGVRSHISENIANNTIFGKVGSFGYNVFNSTVDSALGAALLGKIGLSITGTQKGAEAFSKSLSVFMGSGAFNSAYKDGIERGLSEDQAFAIGLANGMNEAIFEEISLDRLVKNHDLDSLKKAFMNVITQAGVEGSEEMFTDFANMYAEKVLLGNQSKIAEQKRALMSYGYSEDDADWIIFKEKSWETLESFLAGAASGGLSTMVYSKAYRTDYGTNRKTGESIRKNQRIDDLANLSDKYTSENEDKVNYGSKEYKNNLLKKYDGDLSKATDGELGVLFRKSKNDALEVFDKNQKDKKEEVRQYAEGMLLGLGESESNASVMADSIVKDMYGEELDRDDKHILEIDNVKEVEDAIINNGETSSEAITESLGDIKGLKDMQYRKEGTIVNAERLDGKKVEITNADGTKEVVKESKLDSRTRSLIDVADDYSGRVKELFISNYSGQNLDLYINAFDLIEKSGETGTHISDDMIETLSKIIPANQISEILKESMRVGGTKNAERMEAFEKAKKNWENQFNKGTFSSSLSYEKLNYSEKALYDIAKAFSEIGMNITVIKDPSKKTDGRFSARGNTVYINLAARYYRDASVNTAYVVTAMSHEFTHWMQHQDKLAGRESDGYYAMLETLVKNDLGEENWNKFIKDQQDKYAKNHKDEPNYEPMSYEKASSEVVARACENMLNDTQTMARVLRGANETTVARLRNAIIEFFDSIHEILSHILGTTTSGSEIAQMIEDMDGKMEELREVWVKGLESALAYNQNFDNAIEEAGLYTDGNYVYAEEPTIEQMREWSLQVYNGETAKEKALFDKALKEVTKADTEEEQQSVMEVFEKAKENDIEHPVNKRKYKLSDEDISELSKSIYNGETEEEKALLAKALKELDAYEKHRKALKEVTDLESQQTFSKSDYAMSTEKVANEIAEKLNVPLEEARRYIKDVSGVASYIKRNAKLLDYVSSEGKSAWVSNPEYGGSLDYSFLCPKRLTYTGTMNAIRDSLVRKGKDMAFSVTDFLFLRASLKANGYESPCSFCFVESARMRFDKYNKKFIKNAQKEGLKYIPTFSELNNPDMLEKMGKEHPETFAAYTKYMNSLSQRKPKMLEERRAYDGEILKAFSKDTNVKEKNLHGGIRFNSFSDFEVVHMIDSMQAILDMSRVGLAGFGYTKQKGFAEVFGNTGLKINLSCVAKGVSADGMHIVFDDYEGMNSKDAIALRNRFSKNVGVCCVVFTDEQLKAALCDERIDYVLPFHRSQWSSADYAKLGLPEKTKDFTKAQTEKGEDGKRLKAGNTPFLSYWDFNKSGKENVQNYLDKVINNSEEKAVKPLFADVLTQNADGTWSMYTAKDSSREEQIKEKASDNYWKLLTEFKLYDNEGNPSPQNAVKPTFEMKDANRLLKKYDGSHTAFPVANNVVDEFLDYKENGFIPENDVYDGFRESIINKFTIRYVKDGETNIDKKTGKLKLSSKTFKAEDIGNAIDIAIDKGLDVDVDASYEFYEDNTTLNSEQETSLTIYVKDGYNKETGETVDFINLMLDKKKLGETRPHKSLTRKKWLGLAKDGLVYGRVRFGEPKEITNKSPEYKDAYIENTEYGLADGEKKYYYPIVEMEDFRDDPRVVLKNGNYGQYLYSEQEYAPVFYSKMARVIDDIKGDKIGSASVVSYLKGRGVKDEEIKWSGIETFLDGKKSVTKADLQEFAKGSMLQIEETTLRDYSDGQQTSIDKLGYFLDEYGLHGVEYDYFDDYFGFRKEAFQNEIEEYYKEGDLTEEQYNKIIELSENVTVDNETHWSEYKTEGTTNYRELLFKMPNADYTNRAMDAHWQESGVLAHARIGDQTLPSGERMLFVEEIQSDWHNAGHERGYASKENLGIQKAAYKLRNMISEEMSIRSYGFDEFAKKFNSVADKADIEISFYKDGNYYVFENMGMDDVRTDDYAEFRNLLFDEISDMDYQFNNDMSNVPEAPFKSTYTDFVMKRLLRMAAEGGYDYIGWTTADMQSKRWSDEYAEGYRIEYDQDIPKFMNKYGKQWGAKVEHQTLETENEVWSVPITEAMKNSVLYEGQTLYSEQEDEAYNELRQATKEVSKQYDKMVKDVANLEAMLKLDKTKTLDPAQLRKTAQELIEETESSLSVNEVIKALKETYDYILQLPNHRDEARYERTIDMAKKAAKKILTEQSGAKLDAYSKEVLTAIRKSRVKFNDEQKAEAINAYGGKYRDAFMGKIVIVKDGIELDSWWQDMAENYPGLFNSDVNSSDMPTKLIDIINSLKTVKVEEQERTVTDEDLNNVATRIYEKFWEGFISRNDLYDARLRSIMDQHEAQIKALREAQSRFVSKQIAYAQSQQRQSDSDYWKNRLTEEKARMQDAAIRKATIEKITKNALDLKSWMDNTKTKSGNFNRVPEDLKRPVSELILAIDFSSKQMLGMTSRTLHAGTPTERDKKLSEALAGLNKIIENANTDKVNLSTYLDLPPTFIKELSDLTEQVTNIAKNTPKDNAYVLNQMSTEQLESLLTTIKVVRKAVTDFNKLLANANGHSVDSVAFKTIEYANKLGKRKYGDNWRGNFFAYDQALPHYAFKRFGEGSSEMFTEMKDGWDQFAFNALKIKKFAANTYKAEQVRDWNNTVHTFDILEPKYEGHESKHTELKLTSAQIMSLYCLSKREQGLKHILGGGITPADIEYVEKKFGKKKTIKQPKSVKITRDSLDDILSVLTKEQRDVADALQKFMANECADWGNEITMKRFGILGFTEENYFPINADSDIVGGGMHDDPRSIYALLNMSFTKALNDKANSPIVLSDIFLTFTVHASDMAKYNALALPVLDMIKWLHFKDRNRDGSINDSTIKSLKEAFGEGAYTYVEHFLSDINGNSESHRGEKPFKKMLSNYKRAAIGGNAQVALLQPLSYIRAYNAMDKKYLNKALREAVTIKPIANGMKESKEHSGMTIWKDFGFFNTDISRGLDKEISQREDLSFIKRIAEKAVDISMMPAGFMDSVTWGIIWNACKYEVEDTMKLQKDSEEYYKAINDKMRDIIYRTQVIDCTMTRSDFMRSTNPIAQLEGAFMSETTLSYNVVMDGISDIVMDAKIVGKGESFKRHGKKLAKAINIYVLSALVESALRVAVKHYRGTADDDEELWEQYAKQVLEELNPLTKIPYFKSFCEVAENTLNRRSTVRMDEQFIVSTVQMFQAWAKAVDDGWTYKTTYNTLKAVSQMSGLPMASTLNEIVSAWNFIFGNMFPDLKINK